MENKLRWNNPRTTDRMLQNRINNTRLRNQDMKRTDPFELLYLLSSSFRKFKKVEHGGHDHEEGLNENDMNLEIFSDWNQFVEDRMSESLEVAVSNLVTKKLNHFQKEHQGDVKELKKEIKRLKQKLKRTKPWDNSKPGRVRKSDIANRRYSAPILTPKTKKIKRDSKDSKRLHEKRRHSTGTTLKQNRKKSKKVCNESNDSHLMYHSPKVARRNASRSSKKRKEEMDRNTKNNVEVVDGQRNVRSRDSKVHLELNGFTKDLRSIQNKHEHEKEPHWTYDELRSMQDLLNSLRSD